MADPMEVQVVSAERVVWSGQASNIIARTTDGGLTWRATVSGPIEIRLWILSWGDDVEVLAPASLRADVAATHARAAERYGPRAGTPAETPTGTPA
jgi:predicted DNA-binding transcriptional regulator YafY